MKRGLVAGGLLLAIGIAIVAWLLRPGAAPAPPAAPPESPAGAIETRPRVRRDIASAPISGRPFATATDKPVAESRTGGLLVTVVNADNRPVKGASVAICDPSEAASQRATPSFPVFVTGADGSARVPIDVPMDVAHIVVLARGYAPALARVTHPTRQTVTLPGDALLRGKVLVDGSPPRAPMKLYLQGYRDPTSGWGPTLQNHLAAHGFGTTRIPFDTDATGGFEVRGVTRGEMCVVACPQEYVMARGEERGTFGHIVTCDGIPVTIELATRPVLTGRLVVPKGADPPTGELFVGYKLEFAAGGGNPDWGRVQADLDRPFRIFYFAPELSAVSLEVLEGPYPGRRLAQRRIEKRIVGSHDVGEIVLDQPKSVTFLFKDADRKPVPDARVLALGHVSPRSGPDGKTKANIYPGIRAVVIGAPRFAIQELALPDPLPALVDVALEPACMVVVRVRHEDPSERLEGLYVHLAYEVDDVVAAADASEEFEDVRIAKPVRSIKNLTNRSGFTGRHGITAGHQTFWYPVRPGESLVVSGFKKTDEPTVRIGDGGDPLLAEAVSFSEGNVKEVDLVVKAKARTIRAVVVGDRGPIRGARIGVAGIETSTDASGTFEIANLYRTEAMLSVTAHGYVSQYLKAEDVMQSQRIVLDRARRLVVHLTGPSVEGRAARAVLQIGSETYEQWRLGPDQFVFSQVPCRAGTFKFIDSESGADVGTPVAIGAEETQVEIKRP